MATSLKDFIAGAQDRLAAAGIENPGLDVRLLVQHVLGWPQAKLLTSLNYILSEAEAKDLNAAINRRLKREPVSRIIGHRGFWKSEFRITPQTLDPRPDSETLIEMALKLVRPEPSAILDLGTGTGCLLLSLLIEYPNATGVGIDISEEATATARENAAALDLAERAQFVATGWENYAVGLPLPAHAGRGRGERDCPASSGSGQSLSPTLSRDERRGGCMFDLVISNPPYIAQGEMEDLSPEVAQYDPRAALVSGPEGLECYRSIASRLNNWLKPGGWALFEIGHTQGEAVKSILAQAGMIMIQVVPDLAGSDRVIAARRP